MKKAEPPWPSPRRRRVLWRRGRSEGRFGKPLETMGRKARGCRAFFCAMLDRLRFGKPAETLGLQSQRLRGVGPKLDRLPDTLRPSNFPQQREEQHKIMKKFIRKLLKHGLAALVALTMCLGMAPTDAWAAEDTPVKTDNVIQTAYSQFNPNTNLNNTVYGGVAENGYGTVVLDDEHPTATDVAFCKYWGAHISGWPNGFQMIEVEQNTNPSVATAVARSTENGLVVDFQKGAGTEIGRAHV